ncbi:hypothetical protein [Merismopedia glauca]|uniref:Uncharacterized protein n=1 Tax=Merismopedia glauca CCAP 1448/3 TaxID=1296344 RepID=A0A2T1BZA7_9CYAN|nr:hypothetical protein [Merismopedia glauca]PSB01360.1 hypothetical protein C7B64_18665 [Merismopedia glauca CCAP 1448/3]
MEYQEKWDEWSSKVEIEPTFGAVAPPALCPLPPAFLTYQPNRIKDPIGLLVKLGEVASHPKYARFVFGYFRLGWGVFLMVSAINGLPEGFWAGIVHILQYDPTTADLSWQQPVINYYAAF